jgi:4'-phosphopantetheinyl transferase
LHVYLNFINAHSYNKNIDEHSVLAIWKIEETEAELLAGLQLKQHELDIISSFNNGKRLVHWLSTRPFTSYNA